MLRKGTGDCMSYYTGNTLLTMWLCVSSLTYTAGSSERAVLRYKFTAEKEVDLMSTNVPESFRGKGVAALLSKVGWPLTACYLSFMRNGLYKTDAILDFNFDTK